MKSRIIILIIVLFLFGCTQAQETIQPTSTTVPEPTNTPEPTATKDYSHTKNSIITSLSPTFSNGLDNLHITDMIWESDVLKLRGRLINFVDEPKDHSSQHFILLKYLHEEMVGRFNVEFMAEENTSIMIITEGFFSGSETLSITDYETFIHIGDGSISTEVEWVYEVDITVK